MKALSSTSKIMMITILCQVVVTTSMYPMTPLQKKLKDLSTKLGSLRDNLAVLKQKLQNLKSTLSSGVTAQ